MFVRSLAIKNLRGFDKAELDFVYPGREADGPFVGSSSWPLRLPNVNLILGINSAGKSTLLDAIALAILSPLIATSGYRPYLLIRRPPPGAKRGVEKAELSAELVLHAEDGPTAGAAVTAKADILKRGDVEMVRGADNESQVWEKLFDDESPAYLLLGYGAGRRVEVTTAVDLSSRRRERQLRYERVASLFEDSFGLMPLNAWFPRFEKDNPGRHKQAFNLLNKLMPPGVRMLANLENDELLFTAGGSPVPFNALSDGFKSYIGWIGDLLYQITRSVPSGRKLAETKGVVLIDEIDLHIHPEWQRELIPTLARTLPNVQFILTTHSPLVVGTLERANILTVERSQRGVPRVLRPTEETYGLTADQLLRSEMFGLDSTRDPEFKTELDRLSRKAATGDLDASIAFMNGVAGGAAGVAEATPPDWVVQASALTSSDPVQ